MPQGHMDSFPPPKMDALLFIWKLFKLHVIALSWPLYMLPHPTLPLKTPSPKSLQSALGVSGHVCPEGLGGGSY